MLNRRDFITSSLSSCSCCAISSRAIGQQVAGELDFCSELHIPDVLESRAIAIDEWEGNRPSGAVTGEAASRRNKQWSPNRDSLYIEFVSSDLEVRLADRVVRAARLWEPHLGIQFRFGASNPTTGRPDILVAFQPGNGHWSYVGTDSSGFASSGMPSMNLGWSSEPREREIRRVVLHEFGHALSLIHEHQHPDVPIPWDRAATIQYYADRQNWNEADVERWVFSRYSATEVNRTVYDPDSIMHYAIPAELLTDSSFATTWNTRLSALDAAIAETLFA